MVNMCDWKYLDGVSVCLDETVIRICQRDMGEIAKHINDQQRKHRINCEKGINKVL